MLPHIHHDNGLKTGGHSVLMKSNPVVGKLPRNRVLVENCPTHASHDSHSGKSLLPVSKAAEILLEALLQFTRWFSFPFGREVFKVVFVQHHSSVFKAEMASQLCVSGVFS